MNSVAVGDCGYFDGKSFTHDVDNCRAVGNAVAFAPNAADAISMVNTTVYGEGDCLMEISECTAGTTTFTARNNVFLGDVDFLQPFEHACFYWEDCPGLDFDADWNLVFGTKDDHPCPIGADDMCDDPQLGPLSGDEYGMVPATTSPAIDSGLGVGGVVPDVDFLGSARPAGAGVDRGAYEVR